MVLRVRKGQPGQGWPVELCLDDGSGNWHQAPLARGLIPAAPDPAILPPDPQGIAADVGSIVPFLLTSAVPDPYAYLRIGQHLYDVLHRSGIGEKWNRLRTDHEAPSGPGLRTVFDIQPDALQGLPWETLTDHDGRSKFLDSGNPSLRGSADYGRTVEPYLVPLRILVVVGDSTEGTGLQWREELDAIHSGLVSFGGRAEAKFLIAPTIDDLESEHSEFQPHVFHFIGHGVMSQDDGAALILHNAQAGPRDLRHHDIVNGLTARTGRLAILNACQTGRAPGPGAAAVLSWQAWSLAETFGQAGYPSVIGMQADIPAAASVVFTRTLYQRIGAGDPVDVAVAVARRRVGNDPGTDRYRDWVLPSLVVSAAPERLLAPRYGVSDVVRREIEQAGEFGTIGAFVDRTQLRRDVYTRLEEQDQAEPRHLMVVRGDDDIGKTSLVLHALRTCAWRGQPACYITFKSKSTLKLLDVLRIIRDGSSRSFISPGLPPPARDRLTHDLNYLCRGERPPPFTEAAAGQRDDCTTWEPGELIDAVFASLHEVLAQAAEGTATGRAPFILALDHIESIEEPALRQLADGLLLPVARGNVKGVKVIAALRSSQPRPWWWPAELTGMARDVELEKIEEEFEPLAREFLQHRGYRGQDLERASVVIDGYKRFIDNQGKKWSPGLLTALWDGLSCCR